jgi:hypothetical protein
VAYERVKPTYIDELEAFYTDAWFPNGVGVMGA